MTDKEIIKALEILDFFDFFNQRAGRELWSDKPREVQEEDIAIFTHKVKVLRDFINRQQAEIERLERELDIALENDPSKTHPYEVITPYGVVFSKCEKGYEDFKMDIKSEAIKEFANEVDYEILHKEFWNEHKDTSLIWLNGYEQCMRDVRVMLKDKVKEMVGEDK